MGAVGVHTTIDVMRSQGFDPIELERYCSSNKIWGTKVKRLRLPDIMCVRTGVRVEVRAKSDLKVRMSDAPDNPKRRWDVGLRDDDLVAFVACNATEVGVDAIGQPIFFTAADLRASVGSTKLGSRKSASEGAEQDREWPRTVPSKNGEVIDVRADKIVTTLVSGRRQTYQLKGKRPYITPGKMFIGGASIIAGVIPQIASLAKLQTRRWDYWQALSSQDPVERYAAAKAIPHVCDGQSWEGEALSRVIAGETDGRVSLELAASAARLGFAFGLEYVSSVIWKQDRADLRMESVLILTELATPQAAKELIQVASSPTFSGDEIRQAAVWGLGRAGTHSYLELVDFICDDDDNVALHAITAFGPDTPANVLDILISVIIEGTPRACAAASKALTLIGSDKALTAVARAARKNSGDATWLLATLGRFPASHVREILSGDTLLARVEPLLTLDRDENWLAQPAVLRDLDFLLMQNL